MQTALDFGEQTGRNYMNASIWADSSPTVGVLSPTAIYEGASAPVEVKTEILRMIDAGEIPPATKIKEMIREHKAEIASSNINEKSDQAQNDGSSVTASKQSRDNVESIAEEKVAPIVGTIEPIGSFPRDELGAIFVQNDSAVVQPIDMAHVVEHEEIADEITQAAADRAATELLARLQKAFDDYAIRELVDIWRETTTNNILKLLDAVAIQE